MAGARRPAACVGERMRRLVSVIAAAALVLLAALPVAAAKPTIQLQYDQ